MVSFLSSYMECAWSVFLDCSSGRHSFVTAVVVFSAEIHVLPCLLMAQLHVITKIVIYKIIESRHVISNKVAF